ncbi:MAG: hypothetical protein GTO18_18145 [Anaerolineales bacterium]|nr:hypothetical protein [Anaerolineales bacterium]
MDNEYQSSSRSCANTAFDFLTIIVLLATLFIGGIFVAIYINPYAPFNPFPPPGEPTQPIETDVPELPPTWTVTVEVIETSTPTVTPSPPPTNTPVVASPEPTPVPYIVQPGTPNYTENFANEEGCNWMGVAGQVLELDQSPVQDLWVHLGGQLEGTTFDLISLPGSAPAYGEGGYEFTLSDHPITSENLIWVQLIDPAENPLSEKIYLITNDECDMNLTLVNWILAP